MKPSVGLSFVVVAMWGAFAAGAQLVWQPSAGHTQVEIWPGAVPDALLVVKPESVETDTNPKKFIGSRPVTALNNVSRPTMTVYSPTGKNTGAAVVVHVV